MKALSPDRLPGYDVDTTRPDLALCKVFLLAARENCVASGRLRRRAAAFLRLA
jgi:hypothetical protein